MNKAYRQGQILKLIRAHAVHTQEDLVRELRETLSIPATQVTLSRDIRELGLVKTPDGYRQVTVRSGPSLAEVAAEFLHDVRQA
ncbi:MAG: ArgR family transcriptional regulator, partial [Bryobacteraceae bacterium]